MGQLRAERSESDRPVLLRRLADKGIALKALPDFRGDVEALTKWTVARLEAAPGFTRLLADQPGLTIERAAWTDFEKAANAGSLLLVGEPGAGKSGFMYRLGEAARGARQDVVFLPVQSSTQSKYWNNPAKLKAAGKIEVAQTKAA